MTPSSTVPPVGVPIHDLGLGLAYRRFWAGIVRFGGRSSRRELWLPYAVHAVIGIVLGLAGGILVAVAQAAAIENRSPDPDDLIALVALVVIVLLLAALIVLLPTLAAMTRRLRDAGFPPLLSLLALVGLGVVPLVLCALPSSDRVGLGTA